MKPYITVASVVVLIALCDSYQQCCVSIRHESEGKCGGDLSEQTPDLCFGYNDKLKEAFDADNNNNQEYCIWDCDGHLSSMYNRGQYIAILSKDAPSHLYPNYMKLRHVDMGVAYTVVHNLTMDTADTIPIYYNNTKRRRLITETDFKKIATYENPTTGKKGAAQLPFQPTGVLKSYDKDGYDGECVASVIYKKKTVAKKTQPPPGTPAKYDIALLTAAHCCYDKDTDADNEKVEFHNIDQNSFPGDTSKALLGNNKGSPKYRYFYPKNYATAELNEKYLWEIDTEMEKEGDKITATNKKKIKTYVNKITDMLGDPNIKKAIDTINEILKDVTDVSVNKPKNIQLIYDEMWTWLNKAAKYKASRDWCVIKWTKVAYGAGVKTAKNTMQIKYDQKSKLGKLLMSTYRSPGQKPKGKTYYKKYFVSSVHVIEETPAIYWMGHESTAAGQSGSAFVEESDPNKIRAVLSRSHTHGGNKRAKDVKKDWLTVITKSTFESIVGELGIGPGTADGKGKVAGTAVAMASDYGDYQQSVSYHDHSIHQHHPIQHHPQKIYESNDYYYSDHSDYPAVLGVGIISGVIVTGTIGFICICMGILIGVIGAKFVWNLNKK
mmetsp:Transcript_58929/g.53080  ORF Transcript_58929/g.53080 Transcript_58929/m.53080 type:complete len:608 (+) Transcript_58929:66-1889(+)